MSGGSYEYAFTKVNDFVERLEAADEDSDYRCEMTPLRKAFCDHLLKVSEAMRMIEWVDSGDCSPGDEDRAIKRCLGVKAMEFPEEDDEVVVHRPDRDDVNMPWSQWRDNEERYEAAGFTWSVRPSRVVKKVSGEVLKSTQGACSDDDVERWSDKKIVEELVDLYSKPEDFINLRSDGEFNYQEWVSDKVVEYQAETNPMRLPPAHPEHVCEPCSCKFELVRKMSLAYTVQEPTGMRIVLEPVEDNEDLQVILLFKGMMTMVTVDNRSLDWSQQIHAMAADPEGAVRFKEGVK